MSTLGTRNGRTLATHGAGSMAKSRRRGPPGARGGADHRRERDVEPVVGLPSSAARRASPPRPARRRRCRGSCPGRRRSPPATRRSAAAAGLQRGLLGRGGGRRGHPRARGTPRWRPPRPRSPCAGPAAWRDTGGSGRRWPSTASYTAPWTMAKLMTATGGGCLATPTIAVEAVSFQSVTVSARANDGASVAPSAATPRSAPMLRMRARVRCLRISVSLCSSFVVARVLQRAGLSSIADIGDFRGARMGLVGTRVTGTQPL